MFNFFRPRKKHRTKPAQAIQGRKSLSSNTHRPLKKISVNHLKVGMFVSELDRPWLETPFAIQGFYLYSETDIDEIRKYSEFVYIDVYESRTTGALGLRELGTLKSAELQSFPDKDSWSNERQTYERVTQLTFGLLDKIALDSGESSETVRAIVDSCVDSVISNPYALALISQMQRASAELESHAVACCALATSFGRFLGMNNKELENLALGALLHDVGMLKLPSSVVRSQNRLSPQQKEVAHLHASKGSAILTSNEYYWPAVDIAYAHHERVDGTGYPRGLKGAAIPYNARIVSIVDVYDRLTSSDSYRQPILSPTNAMGEIYAGKGTQFDSQLVEKFIRFMGVYPLGTLVQLNTGETAIVVEKNPFYMVLPKVLVVTSNQGTKIKPFVVDLFEEKSRSEESKIKIIKTLSMSPENASLLKEATFYKGDTHSPT